MENNQWINLSILFLCFTLLIPPYHGADTITANQTLSGNQTILSAGEKFELGFFQPGNSSDYYIGVWYSKSLVQDQTIVWVANRDSPVSDKYSSEFKILNGNLVITNGSKTPVWSTNVTLPASGPVEAVLQDEGNLVLRDQGNINLTIWQSFDHPTHTWLPGGKLGLNKKTKKSQLLIAWKNIDDPATGLFSLEPDPNGTSQYYIFWNRTEKYWNSGTWDFEHHIFSLIPEMIVNPFYDVNYVDNENESYFTYSVKDPSFVSRVIVDVSGQAKDLTWLNNSQQWNLFWSQPREQCEVYAYCGAFGSCNQNSLPFCNCLQGFEPTSESDWQLNDYSRGCARKTDLQCENHTSSKDRDKFWMYSYMGLPQRAVSMAVGGSGECESACLSNCSCTAYAYDDNGCSIWIGDLLNVEQLSAGDSNGRTLYIRLAASEFPSSSNKKIIGIVVGCVAGIAAALCLILVVGLQKRKKVATTKTVEGSLVAFVYRDLQTATKNFSEKLGGGGFGSVFKGTLPDSSVIAVKKLESISQGEKQFRTEVSTIGTIQHVNLVRLRGFCSEGMRKLLVYDYMPNSSLDTHLFQHGNDSKLLDWKTRYQIAVGTARGLAYLHEECRDCIIHCDIKPENILLDADFCPKVADFGLAKLVGRDFSRVLTTMRGTIGYLPPEWISGVAITAKADVYSYGMMFFELVSGRRNTEQSDDGKVKFFPTWAANMLTEGEDVINLVDHRLDGNADKEEVMKICKVACWCIQDDENHRPTMGQVVHILEGVMDVNLPPIPRSLQVFVDSPERIIFFTESSSTQSSQTRSNTPTSAPQIKTTSSSDIAQSP
ncbi:hypothetical protein Ancab_039360 [Ancistrocladus abbreviatus]